MEFTDEKAADAPILKRLASAAKAVPTTMPSRIKVNKVLIKNLRVIGKSHLSSILL